GRSNAITLGGFVQPYWVGNTSFVSGDTGQFQLLQTANGEAIDRTGLTMINSATAAYTLRPSDDNSTIQANYVIDYTGAASGVALADNERSFAHYFSSAMGAMPDAENMTTTSQAVSQLATEFLNTASGGELACAYREHTLDESAIGAARAVS